MENKGDQYNDEGKLAKKIKNFIYHPGDLIGSGFSSQVFKGINEQQIDPIKKCVAIKVIQLTKIQNQVENYLLNNQVNALKILKHPNILQNIDILMTKNNIYVVTQYCQGGDLLKYIKSNGPLSQFKSISLIKDIIEGYKCIEEHHIIHRDLKTSNIFLCKGKAKIADFGFCEFIGEKKPQIAYNVGSPAYMSPESYKQNHYSQKSDIWSIGIILYEMLVGETPDRNLTYTEMANNLMNGKIKNIQNEEIKKILCTCFKKNLNERIDVISLCQLISMQFYRQQQNCIGEIQSSSYNSEQIIQNRTPQISPPRNVSPTRKSENRPSQFIKGQTPSVSIIPPNQQQTSTVGSSTRLPQNSNQPQIQKTSQQIPSHRSIARQTQKINVIKPHTDYLLFLYRLLKFIVQLKLDKIYQILLPIFRHRNLIQSLVEQQMGSQQQQAYKQFQYLKNRFDEVYLQHTKQNKKRSSYKQKFDQFANNSFLQPESLQFYRALIKDACGECLIILDGKAQMKGLTINRNQVGIVLDYLIIQHELLGLHLQNIPLPDIVSISKLQSIIKEQPKKLTPGHIELFKIKYNTFIATQNDPPIQNHPMAQQIPIISQTQQPLMTKQNQQQPKLVTILNGVPNNQISLMVMGFGQQNHSHPPHNNLTNTIFVPQQNSHQNIPIIQVNSPFVGPPQPPMTPIQQQQQQQTINQYNALINQIPIHQSIMMPR